MKDFEATLRERLERRAGTVHPLSDVGDLDVRIDHARRRRARLVSATAAGVCAALIATAAAVTLRSDSAPNLSAVASPGEGTLPQSTTIPTTTTIATTPGAGTGQTPGTGSIAPVVTPPEQPADPESARREIAQAFDTLFEAGSSDAQRRAAVTSVGGLQELWENVRLLPQFDDFDLVRVHVDSVRFDGAEIAYVDFSFTSADPVKYPGTMRDGGFVFLVDGRWKVNTETVCKSATALAAVAGVDIGCDGRPPGTIPATTTSTTTANPSTTTTSTPTTTTPTTTGAAG